MLTSLRIQNFRSIRDASVKLGQVNLFIGPNNSGKSNFLKGIKFLAGQLTSKPAPRYSSQDFEDLVNRGIVSSKPKLTDTIQFNVTFQSKDGADAAKFQHTYTKSEVDADYHTAHDVAESNQATFGGSAVEGEAARHAGSVLLRDFFVGTAIQKPDPARFALTSHITPAKFLEEDGRNILSFIHNLKENYRNRYDKLEEDFARCVGTLTKVSIPLNPQSADSFKLRLSDQNDTGFWAEEVSEGVLYFLALLCIVHQPNPPKLLLLEEPEKGIHPRRIREVMDFIFELARLRDIQIILTSHSPYVVDIFSDYTKHISIFDRDPETGETLIRNAGEYIDQTNEELESNGFAAISYTDSLGEYWVSGFLGGVPLNNL